MPQTVLSALKGCISFIQLKLSDFFGEPPNIDKVLTERFIQEDKPYNVNKGLILLANNHLELVNPVCPRCGSDRVTKQDYRRRRPILGEFGAQTVYLKRYRCKRCRMISPPSSASRLHFTPDDKELAGNRWGKKKNWKPNIKLFRVLLLWRAVY